MQEEGGPDLSDMQDGVHRPTEADIAKKMAGYEQQRAISVSFHETVADLQNLRDGFGDPDIQEQYYPGWTSEDFQEVLKRLGEL